MSDSTFRHTAHCLARLGNPSTEQGFSLDTLAGLRGRCGFLRPRILGDMSPKGRGILSLTLRIALGGIILYAGQLKMADTAAFSTDVSAYRLLPEELEFITALLLPWLEVVVGVLLLLGFLTRASGILAAGLSVVFAGAIVSAISRGLDVDCGCFSNDAKVDWSHLALNGGMLAAAIFLVKYGGGTLCLDNQPSLENVASRTARYKRPLGTLAGLLLLFGNASYLITQMYFVPQQTLITTVSPIVFDEDSVYLGIVKQGEEARKTIVFRNTGSLPVRLTGVETSCSCTVPTPSKTELQPGESGELTITYHSRGSSGPTRQTVQLNLADDSRPASIEVLAVVRPIVDVVPGAVGLEVGKPQRIQLVGLDPRQQFTVLNIESPLPMLRLKVVGYPKVGVAEIEAVIDSHLPELASDAQFWNVTITTDVAKLPPLNLYVREAPRN